MCTKTIQDYSRQSHGLKNALVPTQETSDYYDECTTLVMYFQQTLFELFSIYAICGPNALSVNMHAMPVKGSMSPRL